MPVTWGFVERVTGIEPALSAWEADVLPLNYTRDAPSRLRCASPARPDIVPEERPRDGSAQQALCGHAARSLIVAALTTKT
jgi:hypothetical protein